MTVPRPDLVRRIQIRMDTLALAVQRYPRTSRVVRLTQRAMAWPVRTLRPHGVVRREIKQAAVVMADAPPQPVDGPRVLFVTYRAWATHAAIETTIAQALRLRGARCEFLYCGGGLPICEMGWPRRDPRRCTACGLYVQRMLMPAKFPTHTLEDLVPSTERDTIAAGADGSDDLDVESDLLWYFRSAGLDPGDADVAAARRDFRISARIMQVAAERVLDRVAPDVVHLLNGLFLEERVIAAAARTRGIRVVSYETGARPGTVFYSTDPDVPAVAFDIRDVLDGDTERGLDDAESAELDRTLERRRGGHVLARPYYERVQRYAGAGGDARPMLAVFTNVSWDTAVIDKDVGAGSMLEWLDDVLEAAPGSPFDVVIRIHPAEARLPALESRERIADRVRDRAGGAANIHVILPEEPADSYALADDAAGVLVYSSTIGLEAAARGRTVAVAGATHYRGRGFTVDLDGRDAVGRLLADVGWTIPDTTRTARARRYAHAFFCRAMVPFEQVVDERFGDPVFTYERVADLAPGLSATLDVICRGILEGTPIRVPAAPSVGTS